MAVYKRGEKGVFYMNFIVNGIRVNKSTGKLTKREAKHVEALERQKIIDDVNATPQQRASKVLVSDVVKDLYDTRWKYNKDSVNSLARAEKVVEILGDIPIGEVDQDTVRNLMLDLQRKGNKPATVNRTLEVLKTMLKYKKLEWDYIKLAKVPMFWFNVTWTFEPFVINTHKRREAHAQEASQLHPRRKGSNPQTSPDRPRPDLGSVRRVSAST